jgi:hypothetical protein
MKPRTPLSKQMWASFAGAVLFSFLLPSSAALGLVLMLQSVKKTNQDFANSLPSFHQKIQAEQDVNKLRKEVDGLCESVVLNGQNEEEFLRSASHIAAGSVLVLLAFNSILGVYAYKVQLMERHSG